MYYEVIDIKVFKLKDKEFFVKVWYEKMVVVEFFCCVIVDYYCKELLGLIVVDLDNYYFYYVFDGGKVICYGIIVGEEVMVWFGIVKVGSMIEWLVWYLIFGEILCLGVLIYVVFGLDNLMGFCVMYFYLGGKDMLFCIYGIN